MHVCYVLHMNLVGFVYVGATRVYDLHIKWSKLLNLASYYMDSYALLQVVYCYTFTFTDLCCVQPSMHKTYLW